jgi:putative addiction module CopG family antidote
LQSCRAATIINPPRPSKYIPDRSPPSHPDCRATVEEGRYASNSEVIREAMRAWQEQEQLRAQRLTKVRAKIAEADAEVAGRRPEVEGKFQILAVEKNQTRVPPSAW